MKLTSQMLTLYAVSDRSWLKEGETLEDVISILLQNGVTCVQLREKNLSDEEFLREAISLKPLCRKYGVPLIINDRVDIARAAEADGVHVGLSDMEIAKARSILGTDAIIGASAHNVEEALAAEAAGADYLGCGAVFGSHTKTDASFLPLPVLHAICQAVSIPVVAIGGITLDNLPALAGIPIAGAAVISALFAAQDPAAACRDFLSILKAKTA